KLRCAPTRTRHIVGCLQRKETNVMRINQRIRVTAGAMALATIVFAGGTSAGQVDGDTAPVYGIRIPYGYRDWTLLSLASVGPPVNDTRAKLGNDIAASAFREGKTPFPDGSIIVRLAYRQAASEESNEAVRREALARGLSPEAVEKLLAASFVA